jgi:hypothetical protein
MVLRLSNGDQVMGMPTTVIAWVTALAASTVSASPTRVREIGLCAWPTHSAIETTWPARCPLCENLSDEAGWPALIRVGVGPMIDMDNRRWDEDKAKERQREKQLREQYPGYAYTYPRGGYGYGPLPGYNYAYPRGGYYDSSPQNQYRSDRGRKFYPYSPNAGYYYDPARGWYHYRKLPSVSPGDNPHDNRSNEQRREREKRP